MLGLRLIARLWRMMRLIARLWNISLPRLTVDIVLVVTGSNVFIEDGPVSTVKSVLFPVLVTEMINLKYQFCLFAAIENPRISHIERVRQSL